MLTPSPSPAVSTALKAEPTDHKTSQWFSPWAWHVEIQRGPLLYGMVAQK